MARRRSTRKKQRGGRRLGSGTFGTAFHPPPCSPLTMPPEVMMRPREYVGKLMTLKKARQELKSVKGIQEKLMKSFKGPRTRRKRSADQYFYIHYAGGCAPEPTNPDLVGLDLKDKMILLYKFGGETLVDYYNNTLLPRNGRSPEAMNIQFENFMRALHSLFYGAQILQEQGVVHMDIKNDNIVVGKGAKKSDVGLIRLIDFGNSCLAADINKPENLFTNDVINYQIWPPEFCVSGTKEGLLNILTGNLEDTRRDLFMDESGEDSRTYYLSLLGYATDAANLETSQRDVVRRMREGVQFYMNRYFSATDEDGDYVYEEFFKDFGVPVGGAAGGGYEKDGNGNIIFNLDAANDLIETMKAEDFDPSDIDEDDIEKAKFLTRMEKTLRRWMIEECDAFSIALEVYEILDGILQRAAVQTEVADRWVVSDDVKRKAEQIKAICIDMINPDISTRITIEDAMERLIKTAVFEEPLLPGYRTAEQARNNAAVAAMMGLGAGPAGGAIGNA